MTVHTTLHNMSLHRVLRSLKSRIHSGLLAVTVTSSQVLPQGGCGVWGRWDATAPGPASLVIIQPPIALSTVTGLSCNMPVMHCSCYCLVIAHRCVLGCGRCLMLDLSRQVVPAYAISPRRSAAVCKSCDRRSVYGLGL